VTIGLSIAVVIASKGRPSDLSLWIDHIARQTYQPCTMIWSVTGPQDLPMERLAQEDFSGKLRPQLVYGPLGLCHQRNSALDALGDGVDIVAFFDDDYLPCDDVLARMVALFADYPEMAGVTGRLLADGIGNAGIDLGPAQALIAAYRPLAGGAEQIVPRTGLYGCNMAMRMSVIGAHRFDTNLPLYGWQEDIDFSRRACGGEGLYWSDAFAGVHRGAKAARVSGFRFGYSQIANIVYLVRKGTMPWPFGLQLVLRNVLANHLRLLRPEPWVDRRGRARGNWLAFRDALTGRLDPMRVMDL
jgi:GT2 family glycosyltransferase